MSQAVGQSHPAEDLGGSRPGTVPWVAPDEHGHHHVFQGGKFPQQVVELKHEANLGVAYRGQAGRGKSVVVDPFQTDITFGGPVEGAEYVEQGALAGPALAHDGDEFPPLYSHIHAGQDGNRPSVSSPEDLGYTGGFKDGRHYSWRMASTGARRPAERDG